MSQYPLQHRDSQSIWHPLTQHQISDPPLGIVKAQGSLLWDETGKSYIDGIASWYTAMYGHCNTYIIDKVTAQMRQLDQVVFTGFTHEPAVALAEKLLELLPDQQQKIFFNDNGSTAVEAAIKMALQYYHNKGEKRDTLIAFEDGFHGDTFGAMSASDLSVYNGPFEDYFLKVERIPVPTSDNEEAVVQQLNEVLKHNNCAAFVYEPLVQGAAGMKFHSKSGLEAMLKLCKQQEVLTIADEVMTGFGKTGPDFASQQLSIQPDIICLSKALTAGMVPMGITSCSQQVYDGFLSEEITKGFFHAHTYSANPLACAAALAGMDLLNSDPIKQDRARIAARHEQFVSKITDHPRVSNARTTGVILAFELNRPMERYGTKRNALYRFFMERGVFLRPLGSTIYTVPPFVTTDEQLTHIYQAMEACLEID